MVTVTSSDVSLAPSTLSSAATTTTTTASSSARTTRSTKSSKNDKNVEEVSSSITTATEMIIVSESFVASSVITGAIETAASHQKESSKSKKLTIEGGSKLSEKSTKMSKLATAKSAKEIAQNESNQEFEQNASLRTSTPILRKSKQRTLSPPQIKNGDLSDHIAYKEYKDAGEYWK